MGSNSKPKGRIPLAYPLFLLGGFMLGLALGQWAIPDDPDLVVAAGSAFVGFASVGWAVYAARDGDGSSAPE